MKGLVSIKILNFIIWHRHFLIALNLLILIIIFSLGFFIIKAQILNKFNLELSQQLSQFQSKVERYGDTLYATRGLFALQKEITQEDWDFYINSQNLIERYPEVSSLNYLEVVRSKDIKDRSIYKNLSSEENHFILKYTSSAFNVIGNDLGSIPERLEAINQSIDQGTFASTKKTMFISSGDYGFVLYLPIYKYNYVDDGTVESRRENVQGVVSFAIPIENFMNDLFDDRILSNYKIQIVDKLSNEVFYDNNKEQIRPLKISESIDITIGNRNWVINVTTEIINFVSTSEIEFLMVIFAGGVLTNFYMYFIIELFRQHLKFTLKSPVTNL